MLPLALLLLGLDDAPLLQQLRGAVTSCGQQSFSTVPMTWNTAAVGNLGCLIQVPPGWMAQNSPGVFKVVADPAETTGFLWLMSNLPGLHWNAASMGEWVVGEIRRTTPDLRVIDTWEGVDPYGAGIVTRVLVVRFTRAGQEEVGSVRLLFNGCSPIIGTCPVLATLTWEPVAQISSMSCVLSQIDAALQCPRPGGGSCSDADCRADCQRRGQADGACVDGSCSCR